MLVILNKILVNQLDPDAVMKKLDEILKAVNPNLPTKTYFCTGEWRTLGPGANAGLEMNMGGEENVEVLKDMINLHDSGRYTDLLKECSAQIKSAPEWLTPRLLCGLAYLGLGDKPKAREMLAEFESKTGPAYGVQPCLRIADRLREKLQ
jgi:hypothetical protein